MSRVINFLREVKLELKKVNWPTRKEVTKLTLIIIGISLAVVIFLGGLDFLFNKFIQEFIIL